MKPKIGVQRIFYYYESFPFFKKLFEELGCEIVLSKETSLETLKEGSKLAVDEHCLPIKHFLGQVKDLKDRCDYVLIPNIVSEKKECQNCSRINALADLAVNLLGVKTIEPSFKTKKIKLNIPLKITTSLFKRIKAARRAGKIQRVYKELLNHNVDPEDAFDLIFKNKELKDKKENFKYKVAVVGHLYSIHDKNLNFNIKEKLKELGVQPVMTVFEQEDYKKVDRPHFILGKLVLDTVIKQQKDVDGIIYLAPFGCSPDALVNIYIREINKIPLLSLIIDQHTAENTIDTRLEAFVDLISRK